MYLIDRERIQTAAFCGACISFCNNSTSAYLNYRSFSVRVEQSPTPSSSLTAITNSSDIIKQLKL